MEAVFLSRHSREGALLSGENYCVSAFKWKSFSQQLEFSVQDSGDRKFENPPTPSPPPSRLSDSHIFCNLRSEFDDVVAVEAVSHDIGAGFSVVSCPAAEPCNDP